MRRKAAPQPSLDPRPEDELRGELEQLGLAPAEAGALAARLIALARELPEREIPALLEAVALGQRGRRGSPRSPELHRLLDDFAAELKKLDEGLRLVNAYVARLREKTAVEPARTLH